MSRLAAEVDAYLQRFRLVRNLGIDRSELGPDRRLRIIEVRKTKSQKPTRWPRD